MKQLFTLILLATIAPGILLAQNPPEAFNYSAVARDANSNPIANTTIGIQISLRQGSPLGTVVYQENHFVNTDQFGLFNLTVGGGWVQSGSMSTINWSAADFYMQVGMDANGGINFLNMGTTQLLSVPYAMHAKTAGSVVGGSNQVFIQAGNNVTITGSGTSVDPYIINSTGSASGLLVTPGNGVTDIDGNNYTTMIYGNQEWMTQNLRTTRYANGDPIQNITGNSQWQGATATGAWSHYNNDSQFESDYGKQNNLAAVTDSRNACPSGWHVDTQNESDLEGLLGYLGGADNAGGRMKSTGTQYWQSPNNLATNESGFSALPGGFRSSNGIFGSEGVDARFWAIETQIGIGGFFRLNHLIGVVDLGSLQAFMPGSASPGFSVRCVKN